MNEKRQSVYAGLALLMVAVIWGSGFIATEYAIKAQMSTSLIMTTRFGIAAVIMLPICLKQLPNLSRKGLLQGCIAGVILFMAFYSQTLGQAHTNVSNSAFLTATNVVMVPFIVWAVSKKRPTFKTFVLAATTLVGIGFLTIKPQQGLQLGAGDMITLLCALMFALHIAYLGLFGQDIEARVLTFLQMAVSGCISLVVLLLTGDLSESLVQLQAGWAPTLYLALFSTCLCYFLQTKAQQYISPGKAGIILCCEGLFGSVFSVILGLEPLTASLLIGGLIILTSVILSELDFDLLKKAFDKVERSQAE